MSYHVQIQPGGQAFGAARDESILDAALRSGVILPFACRSGTCGSCTSRLLSGRVEYRHGLGLAAKSGGHDTVLLCQALPRSDLVLETPEPTTPRDVPTRVLPCKVVKKERLAHDVMRLHLKLPESQRLRYFPGQYLDVLGPNGERRSFSIANAPQEGGCLELHVRHVPGGAFTHWVFHEMAENTIWSIEAPKGSFFLRPDADRPALMLGGGTGFAPLKGMLEHAFQAGDRRAMHLFWGVRARRDLYLPQLPREWARSHGNFRFTPVLSEPRPGEDWTGETGLVHEVLLRAYPELGGCDIYMSGPPAMVEAAGAAFLDHGARPERMFSDAFEYNSRAGSTA